MGTGKIMNKTILLLLLFSILLLQSSPVQSSQIIIKSEEQFQFARQYLEKGEYLRAAWEFDRFIHFFPADEDVPKAQYLMGLCYLKGKKYESARKVLEKVYKTHSDRPLGGKALFLMGESYYLQGVSAEAERYFRMVVENYPSAELKNAAFYRLGWSRMGEDRWKEASEAFKMVEEKSPLYDSSQDLSTKSLKGETLPRKDPTSAGILAAVLPGLGHVYGERYRDGLVSFILNGLFIWAAVESFDQDHDVLGGILTFLEAGWYSGNIYSAVNGAHKYNRKIRNEYRKDLPDRLDLNLFTTRDGHIGLAFKFDF